MNAWVPLSLFSLDALVVAATAWLGVCSSGLHRRGLVESSLAWLLLALAWIAASGVILGLGGALGRTGFLGLHAVGFAALLGWRRSWREDSRHWLDWLAAWGRLLRGGTADGRLVGGLLVILLLLAALSAPVEPMVFDALTYRLSRIGAWLQEGTIRHFATDDPRLNYMPVAPDVVIAWLLGATKSGFSLAPWSQLAGGLLLLGATFGLARTAGLTRLHALGAVAVLLGMAHVAVQFTTVQSDLFTAGVFASGYLLWHRAWVRGEGSWVGGVGVALAFAAKGTVFYLAPGAALWVVWLVRRHPQSWRALAPTAAGLAAAALLVAGPGYWRNHLTYGSLFGPRDAVVLHHGEFVSPIHTIGKTFRNLGTSAVQLLEPTAQPFWLQDVSRAAGERLIGAMPATADPDVFLGLPRRGQLERVMPLSAPDADVVTCGLIGTALFLGGLLVAAATRKRVASAQMLVWGAGVLVYLLVQHALVQWHPWAFRFMVLAAPWMAVVGAWGLGALPRTARVAVWVIVLVSAAEVFVQVQLRTSQAAWSALTQPGRSASYFVYRTWRNWAAQLDPADAPLRLAFPIDHALAAFFRHEPPRPVAIERLSGLQAPTAEAAVASKPGWLVVPLETFLGREGRVLGRTSLPGLAAYRPLQPGERPRPLLYAYRAQQLGDRLRDELLLRTWADAPVRLEFVNPRSTACRFELRTPTATLTEEIPAGGRLIREIPVPADIPALVTIEYAPVTPASEGNLRIRLAP